MTFARAVKRTSSYCYNSVRLNKENVGLLLSGAGDLVTTDSGKAEGLDDFFASGFTNSLSGLCA